jgi:hypothetical protein
MGLLDFSSKLVGGAQADALDDQTKREAFSQSMLQLAAGINPYGGNVIGDVARGLAGGRQVFGEAANRQATQGMSYEELAQYWADKDPAKAQQYAELAQSQNPKTREVFSRTEGVVNDQGETGVLLTYRNGEQEFKPVQYAPNAPSAGRAPATPRVPVGMMWDAEQGRAVQIPGVPVKAPAGRAVSGSPPMPKPVKTTEDERKAAGWLQQARKAYSDMMEAYKTDPTAASPGFVEQYAPIEEMRNSARSPSRQRYAQAGSAFSEAVLRAATGAGVNIDEAKQKVAEVTPQRGDSEAVIKQKIASQEMYLSSLEARAGNAKLPSPISQVNEPMKSLPPASQYPGAVIRDTKFGKRFKSNGKTWEPI